jgi:hypothetical protein
MRANRDRHLPVAALHPQHELEFVIEKTGITTPSQYTGPIFLLSDNPPKKCPPPQGHSVQILSMVKGVLAVRDGGHGQYGRAPIDRLQRPEGELETGAPMGSQHGH